MIQTILSQWSTEVYRNKAGKQRCGKPLTEGLWRHNLKAFALSNTNNFTYFVIIKMTRNKREQVHWEWQRTISTIWRGHKIWSQSFYKLNATSMDKTLLPTIGPTPIISSFNWYIEWMTLRLPSKTFKSTWVVCLVKKFINNNMDCGRLDLELWQCRLQCL